MPDTQANLIVVNAAREPSLSMQGRERWSAGGGVHGQTSEVTVHPR